MDLQEAVNRARLHVWAAQPASFFSKTAVIDADATVVPTGAEAKQGIDIGYNGIWGYSALMVSFANTAEPLYLALHGANRPSHEGVVPLYDRAICLCRQAGFADILLRGDTDFSLTTEFDRWDDDGVRFVFGYNAWAGMVSRAGAVPDELYHELVARAEQEIKTAPRTKPVNVKDDIVRAPALQGAAPKGRGRGQLLLPAGQVQAGLPCRRAPEGPVGRAGRRRAVQRVQALLLHHQRLGDERRPGGGRGPQALQPGEPDRPAERARSAPCTPRSTPWSPTGPTWPWPPWPGASRPGAHCYCPSALAGRPSTASSAGSFYGWTSAASWRPL
jgi:hypothetical protein